MTTCSRLAAQHHHRLRVSLLCRTSRSGIGSIIRLTTLSFALYVAILVYLYPIFLTSYQHRWHPIAIGPWMGGLKTIAIRATAAISA